MSEKGVLDGVRWSCKRSQDPFAVEKSLHVWKIVATARELSPNTHPELGGPFTKSMSLKTPRRTFREICTK